LTWCIANVQKFRYFGRAKELPGVRELFQSRKVEEEEENQVHAYYKKFTNQGPAYFGDLDEADGKILAYEKDAEDEGMAEVAIYYYYSRIASDWNESCTSVREVLGPNAPIPEIPRRDERVPTPNTQPTVTSTMKRKADQDEDMESVPNVEEIKKSKKSTSSGGGGGGTPAPADTTRTNAQAVALYIPFLDVEHLLPPKLPSHDEMENILLALRKNALVEEYFGDS